MAKSCLAVILLFFGSSLSIAADAPSTPATAKLGDTRVLKWKDGKDAVFLLAFDDACPTHVKNVIPGLQKHKIPGTFYVVTGLPRFTNEKAWAEEAKSPYIVLGNHTEKHNGAATLDEFELQLANANESIKSRTPQLKSDRLISYGKPGGVKWGDGVTDAAMKPILSKHSCLDRPPFYGAAINVKTDEEMRKVVDKPLEKGEMGHLDFHGVGGDWLPASMEFFQATLDYLDKHRERLWLTDHASYAKYVAERDSAKLDLVERAKDRIVISLTATTDTKQYDQPLTLRTTIPATWKKANIKQGDTQSIVPVVDGEATYDALPNAEQIILTKAE